MVRFIREIRSACMGPGTTCVMGVHGHTGRGSQVRSARPLHLGVTRAWRRCVRSRAGQHARPAHPERCTDSFGVSGFPGQIPIVNRAKLFRPSYISGHFFPGVSATLSLGAL